MSHLCASCNTVIPLLGLIRFHKFFSPWTVISSLPSNSLSSHQALLALLPWLFHRLLGESSHESQLLSALHDSHHQPEVQLLLLLLAPVHSTNTDSNGFLSDFQKPARDLDPSRASDFPPSTSSCIFPRFAHSRCTSVNRTRIFIQITKKVMSYPPQLRRRERLQQSSSHPLSESCCMHSLRTSLSLFMPFIHLHASTLHSPGLNNKANSILCSMRSLRATKRHRKESPLHLFSHTHLQKSFSLVGNKVDLESLKSLAKCNATAVRTTAWAAKRQTRRNTLPGTEDSSRTANNSCSSVHMSSFQDVCGLRL